MLTPDRVVSTTCPYCGVGCALQLHIKDDYAQVTSPFDSVVNHGNLCVKGRFGYDFIYSADRVIRPLIRKTTQSPGHRTQAFDLDEWREASWDEALDTVADRLTAIYRRDGSDALAVYCCAKATNEDNYLAQKLFRALFRTNNVDHCTRLYRPGGTPVRQCFARRDLLGHGHFAAFPGHSQRAEPDPPRLTHGSHRTRGHWPQSAARAEQRAGRVRFRRDAVSLSGLYGGG